MSAIVESLDSRELATIIWLLVLFAWCLTKPNIREAIVRVVAAATVRSNAIALALTLTYLAGVTAILQTAGLWTLAQFKITVLWFVVAGLPALMDTPDVSRNPHRLRAAAAKNFKLSLLLDFFLNLFKLPLLAELVFVPFTALLGALLAVAQSDEKYSPVEKLLNRLLVAIGVMFLLFETYKVLTSFDEIANANTVRDFALPIIYNIFFIPFLWVIAIYAAYDSVFCRLRFVVKDSQLHAYTKRCLILGFRTDITALNQWFKSAWSVAMTSRSEISESIDAASRCRD